MKYLEKFSKKIAAALALIFAAGAGEAAVPLKPAHLRVNYNYQGTKSENLSIWFWDDVLEPSSDWPAGATAFSQTKKGGFYVDIPLKQEANRVSFLILDKVTGEKIDDNRTAILSGNAFEVWIKQGDSAVYNSADYKIIPVLRAAEVTEPGKLFLFFNSVSNLSLEELAKDLRLKGKDGKRVNLTSLTLKTGYDAVVAETDFNLNDLPLSVSHKGREVLGETSWRLIDRIFTYNGNDLGAVYSDEGVSFKLWAPLASEVKLMIYDKDDQTKLLKKFDMTRSSRGVFQIQLPHDAIKGYETLESLYYSYLVSNPGSEPKIVLDPYARSMAPVTVGHNAAVLSLGSSGDAVGKAAIVNPETAYFPVRAANIKGYNNREDAIIYETHVRDFTSDPSIASDLNARWGTFKAFIEKLPYIKSLGVTHIQLLPVMAWYYGDETAMDERVMEYKSKACSYNWGYDPHNYFSPDGAYSENPHDPALRIRELKELIDAIHEAGMGVILDVVYTHMASASFLNDIVPDYYFFKDQNGHFLGDFGNNLATNRNMAAKFVCDSVEYWFREYKIDGMRWDMMGDATKGLVQECFDRAKRINPDVIFIGEGWRTFKGHLSDPTLKGQGADQDWLWETADVGSFGDELRNSLKSGFGEEGEPKFLSGKAGDVKQIFRNMKGQPDNFKTHSPGSVVHYTEAHDNMTVRDVLAKALKLDPEIPANDSQILKRCKLALAMTLAAQGTAFVHSGQEYGRTKQWFADSVPEQKFVKAVDKDGKPFKHPYFIADSYASSDAVNRFEWQKATSEKLYPENVAMVKYFRELTALRKAFPTLRYTSNADADKYMTLLKSPDLADIDLAMAYEMRDAKGLSQIFLVNADSKERRIRLSIDLKKYKVILDAEKVELKGIKNPSGVRIEGNTVVLAPLIAASLLKN